VDGEASLQGSHARIVSITERRPDCDLRKSAYLLTSGGKPLWTAILGAPSGWYWLHMVSDSSGNIYVGAKGPPLMTELTALDKSGKQMWKIWSGTTGLPSPIGFDAQGRRYVYVSERIVALSR
jgi:hypothetical protein